MSEPKRPTGWGGPPLVPPGPADAEAAARRIRGVAVRTPLLPLSGTAKTFALLGPLANDRGNMLGSWAGQGRAQDVIT